MSATRKPVLAHSESERLQQFISSVTDYAIYMLTPEGNVASWNAGAQRFKGYTADEIIGQHFSMFYTEEDRATRLPWRALQIAQDTGKFEAEGWRVRKDGSRFWASVVIDPIRDKDGTLLGFAKITRDITEKKEAQDAAQALQLAREALLQSQKLEAIGKLTGGIAHDFNNLLNVVTNGLSMLRQRAREPSDLRLIDTMEHAASRGSALTQQLLGFARQQPIKREPRDLSRVIRSFEAVLRRASRNALQFEVDLAPSLPPAQVDPAQFETALLNLIVNARDATADGGRITVSTKLRDLRDGDVPQLPGGRYVEVSVEDTGTGMTQEVVSRAVEPFFTTKEVGRGTGLGLSQVYGMVQQCNGAMHIRSAPGQGTTVLMFFPVDESEPAVALETPDAEKVLVVDDQPEVLEVTCELFRTLGMNAIPAMSAREALNLLQRVPGIEFMLTDVMMPGMTGVDLARKAREIQPQLQVILASGYSGPTHAAQGGELDGFAFLSKPYKLGDVVRKLRELA
jgi:PAS domain S-box-containing protein